MLNNVDPTRAQFDQFKGLPRDIPMMMLNLIKFRAQAVYPNGETVTGAEAYKNYERESLPIFLRVGGEIIWRGKPEGVLIGPLEERWDIAFIARYPTAGSFMEMLTDEHYKLAVVNRQVAVDDSRLIRMGEADITEGFGGSI